MLNLLKIAIITLVILFISTILSAQSASFQPIFKQDEKFLPNKAKTMLKSMNLSIDPCEDFYEFACGSWPKNEANTIMKLQEWITPASYIKSKVRTDLHSLLGEQTTLDDTMSERRVKEFYKSCLATEKNRHQIQQIFLSEVMKNNSGFPAVPGLSWQLQQHTYNWLRVVAQLRYRYGLNILIDIHVNINFQARHENSIYFGEPDTIIPPELCSAEGTKRVDVQDRKYERIEKDVADHLVKWLSLPLHQAQAFAADIITFEFELCSVMQGRNNMENPYTNRNYVRFELNELTHYFNDTIDFNQYIQTSFGVPIYKSVFMSSEPYYQQLVKTINSHNTTVIANYIMYRTFYELAFPLEESSAKRTDHCLNVAIKLLPQIINEMYLRKYAHVHAKDDVTNLFQLLKNVFQSSLDNFLLDKDTFRIAVKKLNDIKLHFATNEKTNLNAPQIDRNAYWNNLLKIMELRQKSEMTRIFETSLSQPINEVQSFEPRMKYNPTQQRIEVGWALLQAPYYHELYPNAIRYAQLGQMLAKELARAFDYVNLSFDPDLNWDDQTLESFRNQTECFRHQLSNYLYNNPDRYNNSTYLRELITINAGVNVAFNTYLNWLYFLSPNNNFSTLSKETLPEYNFTNTQLFFIAYAQMYCHADKLTNKTSTIISPLQSHTLDRFIVNGPLKNSMDFARDFGCATGKAMNPVDKCVIY